MLAAASLHHYTRQDHHAHCCISSSLHKARSPCSLLHLFITTQGKITMLAAASLHHYTRQDHHARCCISSSLHKAKTGWHFPPQLKGEAATTYHNLQRTRHTTSIDVIYTNHLVIYTIIQQQEQNALYFFGIPFP
ncbi:hypothetical protein VitviT2T_010183 [Vitis vinifera]|uniref:Uncharacterized protein n=1 Tax=Vitis vinifera TaxID=29760 RepID=A0ABY9C703_VITVI|nr:hypothetical protein VitviT2T_010183 [Vitis vinifera]